jgi:enoyl-CoA hydratase/carnithine racemase
MLHVVRHASIAEIRLDRPPANALDSACVEQLLAALEAARMDGAAAIVLTGRPGMFSGGLDVPALIELDRPHMEAFWRRFFELNRQLAACPVPVIAAISGHAPAGGAVLALHCDHRVAVAGNYRIGLNEVQVGLPVPRAILLALELAVGARQAAMLATRGALIGMDEALRVGLVDELVPEAELMPTALKVAGELLKLPPNAMNSTRLASRARLLEQLATGDDAAAATEAWFSQETQTGMRNLVARLKKG